MNNVAWGVLLAVSAIMAVLARWAVAWRPDRVWIRVALRFVRAREQRAWVRRLCCHGTRTPDGKEPLHGLERVAIEVLVFLVSFLTHGPAMVLAAWAGDLGWHHEATACLVAALSLVLLCSGVWTWSQRNWALGVPHVRPGCWQWIYEALASVRLALTASAATFVAFLALAVIRHPTYDSATFFCGGVSAVPVMVTAYYVAESMPNVRTNCPAWYQPVPATSDCTMPVWAWVLIGGSMYVGALLFYGIAGTRFAEEHDWPAAHTAGDVAWFNALEFCVVDVITVGVSYAHLRGEGLYTSFVVIASRVVLAKVPQHLWVVGVAIMYFIIASVVRIHLWARLIPVEHGRLLDPCLANRGSTEGSTGRSIKFWQAVRDHMVLGRASRRSGLPSLVRHANLDGQAEVGRGSCRGCYRVRLAVTAASSPAVMLAALSTMLLVLALTGWCSVSWSCSELSVGAASMLAVEAVTTGWAALRQLRQALFVPTRSHKRLVRASRMGFASMVELVLCATVLLHRDPTQVLALVVAGVAVVALIAWREALLYEHAAARTRRRVSRVHPAPVSQTASDYRRVASHDGETDGLLSPRRSDADGLSPRRSDREAARPGRFSQQIMAGAVIVALVMAPLAAGMASHAQPHPFAAALAALACVIAYFALTAALVHRTAACRSVSVVLCVVACVLWAAACIIVHGAAFDRVYGAVVMTAPVVCLAIGAWIEWERAGRALAILAMLLANVAVAFATIKTDVLSQEIAIWVEAALTVAVVAFATLFFVAFAPGRTSTKWCEGRVKLCSRWRLATATAGASVIMTLVVGLTFTTAASLGFLGAGATCTLVIAAFEVWGTSSTRGVHFSPFVFPVTMQRAVGCAPVSFNGPFLDLCGSFVMFASLGAVATSYCPHLAGLGVGVSTMSVLGLSWFLLHAARNTPVTARFHFTLAARMECIVAQTAVSAGRAHAAVRRVAADPA